MATQAEARAVNETLMEQLSTPGMEKRAIDAVNDFTRVKMREDGFYRRILPPLQISNDDLDRQIDTDKPVKVVDKEPDSPAAISLPFASLPINIYIKGPRYRVLFDRIVTPRFTKDVDELRTWVMDIRQVLSDNAIKDMLAEEDSKFLSAVNTALVGQDMVVPASGVPQWQTISGGITRDTLQDAFKIMPRTPSHLEVHTILINNVTIREVMKWGRDEMGGDFSQDLVKNGWSEQEFMNARWIITIKRDLVPDDSIYMFSDPKFIGKSYLLEDTTMYIKREAFMLEFFAYETTGGAIGNTSGLARADFV
jgi:hypothetical protein